MSVLCTKNVGGLCESVATEVLYVREAGSRRWEEYPRCPGHPAADDAAMIRRVAPGAEVRIECLEAEAGR